MHLQTTLRTFGRKHAEITRIELFGSFVHGQNTADSDIDLLLTFDPASRPSLLDLCRLKEELERLLDRPVDLLTRKSVEHSGNVLRPPTHLIGGHNDL